MHYSFFSITVIMYLFTFLYTGHHIRQIFVKNEQDAKNIKNKIIFYSIYGVLSASVFLGFTDFFGNTIQRIGCLCWGVYFYFVIFCFLSDLFLGILLIVSTCRKKQLVTTKTTKIVYLCSVCLCLITVLFGAFYANVVRIKEYDVIFNKELSSDVNKSSSKSEKHSIKIAMFSDIHLGNQLNYKDVKKWVAKINAQNPDLVCISGDFFNDDLAEIENIDLITKEFTNLKSTYGTYACLGNHDTTNVIDDKGCLTDMAKEFFKSSDITLLYEEGLVIDNLFYLAGRSDASPSTKNLSYRCVSLEDILKDNTDHLPVILLDHRPERFEEAMANGVFLQLAGHTHLGQMFPANLLTNITYECDYGMYTKYMDRFGYNFTAIVSSGLGYWGPPLRVGSSCEVVIIEVSL